MQLVGFGIRPIFVRCEVFVLFVITESCVFPPPTWRPSMFGLVNVEHSLFILRSISVQERVTYVGIILEQ